MSIRRTRLAFEDHYTQVPNAWVRDVRLTRKARGLLVELMSHRAGWDITIESLIRDGVEGRDAIRSMIQELESAGYLRRERERNGDGTLAGTDYEIVDPWAPTSENPTQAEPTQGDPPPKKTISQEDHSSDTPPTPSEAETTFETAWAAWPKKVDKKDARSVWGRLSAHQRMEILPLLLAHAQAHQRNTPPKYVRGLATWLRKESWNNPLPVAEDRGAHQPEPPKPKGITIPFGHRPVWKDGYIIGSEPA